MPLAQPSPLEEHVLDLLHERDFAALESFDSELRLNGLNETVAHVIAGSQNFDHRFPELCIMHWNRGGRPLSISGRNPLHCAAEKGAPDMFSSLVEGGFDWRETSCMGTSSADLVAPRGVDFWERLLSLGWDPSSWRNSAGLPLWSFALVSSGCGKREFDWLIEKGVPLEPPGLSITGLSPWRTVSMVCKPEGILALASMGSCPESAEMCLEVYRSLLPKFPRPDVLSAAEEIRKMPVFGDMLDAFPTEIAKATTGTGEWWRLAFGGVDMSACPALSVALMSRIPFEDHLKDWFREFVMSSGMDIDAGADRGRTLLRAALAGAVDSVEALLRLGAAPMSEEELTICGSKVEPSLLSLLENDALTRNRAVLVREDRRTI